MASDNPTELNTKKPRHILVVGGAGTIGQALVNYHRQLGDAVSFTTRQTHDLSNRADLENLCLRTRDIDAAYLCAAVTNIRACEADPASTVQVNVDAVVTIAKAMFDRGTRVVFPSTSLVFDGSHPAPLETHPVDPATARTEYGKQKSLAEQKLIAIAPQHMLKIVRLTKILTEANSLLSAWRNDLTRGNIIRAYSNRFVAPLELKDAVANLVQTKSLVLKNDETATISHASGRTHFTYLDLAHQVASSLGISEEEQARLIYHEHCQSDIPPPGHTALGVTH